MVDKTIKPEFFSKEDLGAYTATHTQIGSHLILTTENLLKVIFLNINTVRFLKEFPV